MAIFFTRAMFLECFLREPWLKLCVNVTHEALSPGFHQRRFFRFNFVTILERCGTRFVLRRTRRCGNPKYERFCLIARPEKLNSESKVNIGGSRGWARGPKPPPPTPPRDPPLVNPLVVYHLLKVSGKSE